jgi:hypothetical protein
MRYIYADKEWIGKLGSFEKTSCVFAVQTRTPDRRIPSIDLIFISNPPSHDFLLTDEINTWGVGVLRVYDGPGYLLFTHHRRYTRNVRNLSFDVTRQQKQIM